MAFNSSRAKKDFPILGRKIGGRPIVYLDSASTSQKPRQVIESMKEFYEEHNSNVHRSVYRMSQEATEIYEGTREKVRKFIGARGYHIVFTKNCTEAINIVAGGWAKKNVRMGDSVVLSVMEHHSNIVPWQNLKAGGARLKFLDIDSDGELKMENIWDDTRITSLTHVSNVLGTVNDVKELSDVARENGSLFMMDAAQSAPHMKIDLRKLGPDFVAFSGHKMLGPTGVGVLAVREDLADDMDPILFGSDMINEVTLEGATFARPPQRFETGTQDISAVAGLSAAIDYLSRAGMENIEKHERVLTGYALTELEKIENLKIFGPKSDRGGVISFQLGDAHPHDVATILDDAGVCIRSGHHCAQPLMKRLGVTSLSRASLYLYNTKSDVDQLADGLMKCKKVLKV